MAWAQAFFGNDQSSTSTPRIAASSRVIVLFKFKIQLLTSGSLATSSVPERLLIQLEKKTQENEPELTSSLLPSRISQGQASLPDHC